MKALSVRLNDALGMQFNHLCKATGYNKNAVISKLIEAFVRYHRFSPEKFKKKQDPFMAVMGMVKISPLLKSEYEIDDVIYERNTPVADLMPHNENVQYPLWKREIKKIKSRGESLSKTIILSRVEEKD